jgi:hypothetical protein
MRVSVLCLNSGHPFGSRPQSKLGSTAWTTLVLRMSIPAQRSETVPKRAGNGTVGARRFRSIAVLQP